MATGGLGGVHRGWPTPPDVSADLQALAQTPALVVSSGVKSLLDVPATSELLETLGVPVLGWRTDSLPLFYAARGGPPSRRASSRRSKPRRSRAAHWELGGGGLLVGRPPDESLDDVEPLIERALAERPSRGVHGQARDAVRPLLPAPRERRPHARGEPRPDRRQRAARRRDRRRRSLLVEQPGSVLLHEPAVGVEPRRPCAGP